jgi:radical SAM protein with 4Fe4S-binding SPASM domain
MQFSVQNALAVARKPLNPTPYSLYIEVTKNCNELCTMCPRTHFWVDRRDNLAFEDFRRIVDQFPGLQRVVLHGLGEPLLNPQLFEMVRYLKARGVYVLFNSNALALNAVRRAALVHSGLDEYRVSFDASRPETYKLIRGIAGLDKVKKNVLALMEAVKSAEQPPKVSLWFTSMHENIAELPGVAEFAALAGIKELYVQRLVFFGKGLAVEEQSLYRKLAEQEQIVLAATRAFCQENGINLAASGGEVINDNGSMRTTTNLDEENPWLACTRPWRLMYVQANGDVSPCCFAPFTGKNGEPILGNIFEQSAEEIWQGQKYKAFRRAFLTKQPPQCCEGCGAKWSV